MEARAHVFSQAAARPDAMAVDDAQRVAPAVAQEIDLEEKRRMDHLESMDKIEKEFTDLKEKLYHEKAAALEEELKKVEAGACPGGWSLVCVFCIDLRLGTHERLVQRQKELETLRQEKIQAAEQWRQYVFFFFFFSFAIWFLLCVDASHLLSLGSC